MITAVALPSTSLTAVPVTMPASLNASATLPTSAGTSGYMHTQSTPSAQWYIVFPNLGRLPNVQIYLTSGEPILTDFVATSSTLTITFPSATSGYAVII